MSIILCDILIDLDIEKFVKYNNSKNSFSFQAIHLTKLNPHEISYK